MSMRPRMESVISAGLIVLDWGQNAEVCSGIGDHFVLGKMV